MLRSLSLLAPVLLAAAPAAQQVTFRGKVEDVSGTTNQFFVDCTDTDLTSTVFNLNLFVGQQVEIIGQWNGSAANPSVNVTAITNVPETFEIGGGAKIGETSNLGFTGTPGDLAVGFLSTGVSFAPFGGGNGVVFLDASQLVLNLSGTIGGSGILQLDFLIPNNPSLIGLEIFGQGGLVSGSSVLLTNPDCKEIDD